MPMLLRPLYNGLLGVISFSSPYPPHVSSDIQGSLEGHIMPSIPPCPTILYFVHPNGPYVLPRRYAPQDSWSYHTQACPKGSRHAHRGGTALRPLCHLLDKDTHAPTYSHTHTPIYTPTHPTIAINPRELFFISETERKYVVLTTKLF